MYSTYKESPCGMNIPGSQQLDGVQSGEYGQDHVGNVMRDQAAQQVCLLLTNCFLWIQQLF